MGLIRVAISETTQCVFALFWLGYVCDYCFIVLALTFAAGRGEGLRWLVSVRRRAVAAFECQRRAVNKLLSFSLLPVLFPSL